MNQSTVSLTRKSFADALQHAGRVVQRRNSIPILDCVLLGFGRDQARLTATDLDMQLEQDMPAATEGEGAFVLPARELADAVKRFKGETVRLTDLGSGRVAVKCADTGAQIILPSNSRDDFPFIKRGTMLAEFQMPAATFGQAIADALPFTSTEETRYYLMGVFVHLACLAPAERTPEHETLAGELAELHALEASALDAAGPAEGRSPEAQAQLESVRERVASRAADISARIDELEAERTKPDAMRFAATDGHRMCRFTQPMPEGADGLPDSIIPTLACKLITRIIGKKPDGTDARIAIGAGKMELRYGRCTLITKLIDGTFPDYTRVIPPSGENVVSVPAKAFADAVEGVASIANERTRCIGMAFVEGEPIILSCQNAEGMKAATIFEEGELTEARAGGIVLGFNAAYMKQAVAPFAGGNVTIAADDPAAPMLIEGPDRPDATIVLMPMRLGGFTPTTRAEVEALSLSPWALFTSMAASGYFARHAEAAAKCDSYGRRNMLRQLADNHIRPAIAYLVESGEPRHIARLRVKAELGLTEGTPAAAEAAGAWLRLIDAYQRQPSGSFAELARRGRDTGQDPAEEMDPAPVEAQDPAAASGDDPDDVIPDEEIVPTRSTFDTPPDEPETVAAVSDNSEPAAPADVVKVLTITGQAVFVGRLEWDNPVQRVLQRFNRDGSQMGERVILRQNIARLVPARNNGDRPLPAAMADASMTERLQRLERLVAGLQPVARPRRSAAHVRAIMAYLQLRAKRLQVANLIESVNVANRQWLEATEAQRAAEAKAAKVDAANECRDIALADVERLRVRCDALERLHAASDVLDAPAKPVNGTKAAIILPLRQSSARA